MARKLKVESEPDLAKLAKHVTMDPCVAHDDQRRTCIVLEDNGETVKFIPLSYENGLEVERMRADMFGSLYTVMPDYPVERAAVLYAQYAHSIGASSDALDGLARFVKLTKKDIEMASKKPAAKAAAKKAPAKSAGKTATNKKPAAAKGEAKAPRDTASALFKQLILEGTKTDDQIFAAVQKKFGLDDKKRSYVAWYRNDLVKKGEKVPAAK